MASSDEERFLGAILNAPEDEATRLVYADWLEERNDPRGRFLRIQSELAKQKKGKKLPARLEKRQKELEAIRKDLDPSWLAFMATLGCEFQPFHFWGSFRLDQREPLPFTDAIGKRGEVVTFHSSFRKAKSWDSGLLQDLKFLCDRMPFPECYYGAASCPMFPFICEIGRKSGPLTGADVLAGLKAKNFWSQHIQTLNATTMPYAGYHPDRSDAIHNDDEGQPLFCRPSQRGGQEDYHITFLKQYVEGQQLWYVALHASPLPGNDGRPLFRYVILFAAGRSPHRNRLLGVITHQICHNLCD